jgi:LmbE family N-acetylglucosaminyl deacetylase
METYVPDGLAPRDAWARCTHLGIGAHQDDLEFWAFHGILQCLDRDDRWFGGITCTDGGGSARAGEYANCSDEDLRGIRHREQEEAARIGRYGAMAQLNFPSAKIKQPAGASELADRLTELLLATRAEVVYTHSPADKHETHIAVFAATIQALRRLPADRRPKRVLGYEGWRDLDWMLDSDKTALDVGGQESLADQICAWTTPWISSTSSRLSSTAFAPMSSANCNANSAPRDAPWKSSSSPPARTPAPWAPG